MILRMESLVLPRKEWYLLAWYPPFGLVSRVIDVVSFFFGERRSGLVVIVTEIVRSCIAEIYPWSACFYRRSFRVILFLGLLLSFGRDIGLFCSSLFLSNFFSAMSVIASLRRHLERILRILSIIGSTCSLLAVSFDFYSFSIYDVSSIELEMAVSICSDCSNFASASYCSWLICGSCLKLCECCSTCTSCILEERRENCSS